MRVVDHHHKINLNTVEDNFLLTRAEWIRSGTFGLQIVDFGGAREHRQNLYVCYDRRVSIIGDQTGELKTWTLILEQQHGY